MTRVLWFALWVPLMVAGCEGTSVDLLPEGGDDDATADDDDAGDDDVVADDDDTAGDDDDTAGDDDDTVGDDDDLSGATCWTVAPTVGQIALIEVDVLTGSWSEIGRFGEWVEPGWDSHGIARFGDTLIVPIYGSIETWYEVDLNGGGVRSGGVPDERAVTTDGQDLITFCDEHQVGTFCRYHSFDDLVSDTPAATIEADLWASRMTATSDRLYSAWHSTNEIDVNDVHTGAYIGTLQLEGYDDWIQGMSVRGGELLLMRAASYVHYFARFDLTTGAFLGEVEITDMYYTNRAGGLWCE